LTIAVELVLAVVLGLAAALKVRDPARSSAALAVYGIEGRRVRFLALGAVVAVELGLAGGLAGAQRWAAWGAAGLFAMFALATLAAVLAGRSGLPCACFGSRSRLGWTSPLRATLLAGLSAVAGSGWLPHAPSSYDSWLTAGLALALIAVCALSAVVLALAREVGVLRLSLAGQGALEIAGEGPAVGHLQEWAASLGPYGEALLGLAVFRSDGCPLCRRVEPAVAHLAADPLLVVRVFDEVGDAATWSAADIPGSPYAVAVDSSGVALAKGTFNNLAQLESIIATARARQPELANAA
jgi:hypothetical protein